MRILFRPCCSFAFICLFILLSFVQNPSSAQAKEMRNKLGYVSYFVLKRDFHFTFRLNQLRIGRNSWEIGWYDDGGIGVAKVFRTSSAPYFTFGPVFGSFNTIGFQAGAGLEFDVLSFAQIRAEIFAVGTAEKRVDGTGQLGATAHF